MSIKEALKDLGQTMTGEACEGNTTKSVLKSICKNITGKDSNGKTISAVIKDIDNNYPDKITIDTNVGSTDLLGKTMADLQENVAIEGNNIVGKLKYVTDYTGFSGDVSEQSGNYLVLHITANNDEVIKAELINGLHGQVTLDDDGILITRISNKATQSIQIKNGSKTVDLSISDLVLEPEPTE